MKAIKFYKHVVQSVEKFILKCKQEYKIPGLYVIDSIVRQSRHQFGAEKDVFAPRFARNMQTTFANLYQCSPEDKSKIIRVLNLWQKNNVFAPEVIQPLFDLADPNHPIYQTQGSSQDTSVNGKYYSCKTCLFLFIQKYLFFFSSYFCIRRYDECNCSRVTCSKYE